MKLKSLRDSVLLEAEYKAIIKAIKDHDNNRSAAARFLGIDRKTLYNKIWKYEATKSAKQKVA